MLMVRHPNRAREARAAFARLLSRLGLRGTSTLLDAHSAVRRASNTGESEPAARRAEPLMVSATGRGLTSPDTTADRARRPVLLRGAP